MAYWHNFENYSLCCDSATILNIQNLVTSNIHEWSYKLYLRKRHDRWHNVWRVENLWKVPVVLVHHVLLVDWQIFRRPWNMINDNVTCTNLDEKRIFIVNILTVMFCWKYVLMLELNYLHLSREIIEAKNRILLQDQLDLFVLDNHVQEHELLPRQLIKPFLILNLYNYFIIIW